MTNIIKAWTNRGITLWQLDGESPDGRRFRGCLDVSLRLKSRREMGGACRYCGSPLKPGENCVSCGGPAGDGYRRAGVAEMTLIGHMPFGQFLLTLPEKTTFELTQRDCGRADVFDPDQVFMRLVDMEMVDCGMPNLVAVWDEDSVKIEAVFEGQAQVLIKEGEE